MNPRGKASMNEFCDMGRRVLQPGTSKMERRPVDSVKMESSHLKFVHEVGRIDPECVGISNRTGVIFGNNALLVVKVGLSRAEKG